MKINLKMSQIKILQSLINTELDYQMKLKIVDRMRWEYNASWINDLLGTKKALEKMEKELEGK